MLDVRLKMTPHDTTQEYSLISFVGWVPIIIALVAISIGVVALIRRKRQWIMFSLIMELALSAWGISITCWRLFEANYFYLIDYADPDVPTWLGDFGMAWTAAAYSLAGTAVGFSLVAIASLLTRDTEQDGAHQPATR